MRLENGNIKCDLIRRGFNGRGVSPPPTLAVSKCVNLFDLLKFYILCNPICKCIVTLFSHKSSSFIFL